MKKRIVMLLSVVALMVVMLAMSVSPAFAAWVPSRHGPGVLCREGGVSFSTVGVTDPVWLKANHNNDGYVCYSPHNDRLYDNRIS